MMNDDEDMQTVKQLGDRVNFVWNRNVLLSCNYTERIENDEACVGKISAVKSDGPKFEHWLCQYLKYLCNLYCQSWLNFSSFRGQK